MLLLPARFSFSGVRFDIAYPPAALHSYFTAMLPSSSLSFDFSFSQPAAAAFAARYC